MYVFFVRLRKETDLLLLFVFGSIGCEAVFFLTISSWQCSPYHVLYICMLLLMISPFWHVLPLSWYLVWPCVKRMFFYLPLLKILTIVRFLVCIHAEWSFSDLFGKRQAKTCPLSKQSKVWIHQVSVPRFNGHFICCTVHLLLRTKYNKMCESMCSCLCLHAFCFCLRFILCVCFQSRRNASKKDNSVHFS